ncbi:hypothetical protein PI124_g16480 [Phytophthora idaei]|nr:hypothetical protein PI125_g16952 [Phytophthora idaei]KAG3140224.1 hypothetical protein PI126_g16119 [Phytophthora idaei]KAG3238559.1 hypothetical protein PI124_g16480 [Phytophthora idaei]
MKACVILHNMIVENNAENGIDPVEYFTEVERKLMSTSQTPISSMKPTQIGTPTQLIKMTLISMLV